MTVTRVERLRSSEAIGAVLRHGRRGAGRYAAVHVVDRPDDGEPRVAVVASRRVGSAVARNRAKRLLREAARRVAWRPGTDVVLVARAPCAESRLWDVLDEVGPRAERLEATRSAEPDRSGSGAA